MLRKIVTVLLCVFMVAGSVIPQNNRPVYAFDNTASNTEDVESKTYKTTSDADFNMENIELESEVKSLRTENTKTFRRVDGTYVVAMYDAPVHYLSEDGYENIDNTLSLDVENDSYENAANKYKLKLPKSIDENKKFKLSIDDYQINWTINDIFNSDASIDDTEKTRNSIKELTEIYQNVTYYNIQNNVNIEYILTGGSVKENIVLEEYISRFSISFDYSLKNLELVLNNYGNYIFVNENNETIFELASLVMIDANGLESVDIELSVVRIKDGEYRITVTPDDNFLKEAEYPVTVDPTIISSTQTISYYDTYVTSQYPTTNYSSSTLMVVSNTSDIYEYCGLMYFYLPTVVMDKEITYARYNLTRSSYTSGRTIALYKNDANFTAGSVTYNTKPSSDDDMTDYHVVGSDSTYTFDITETVREWQATGITRTSGFTIRDKEYFGAYNSVKSEEYGTVFMRPVIEIGYVDPGGIKDYWTYSSQDVGRVGTGYISDYTGQLTFLRNDIDFTTDKQSLGVSFAFSNADKTTNIGYGNGWNINYNTIVDYDSYLDLYYTTDYTGNVVYYHPTTCSSQFESPYPYDDTCYISEDGSSKTLVKREVYDVLQDYLIFDGGNKYKFNTSGYLTTISSVDYSLTISINRDSSNWNKINYVKDSSNNYIRFNYDANDRITEILLRTNEIETYGTSTDYLEKVVFGYYSGTDKVYYVRYYSDYDQNNDTTIDDTIYYSYDSYQRLYQGYISGGEKIKYFYVSSTQDKILEVESYFNSTKFSEVTYVYGNKQTKITDHTENFVIYKFDNYGQTVNVIDKNTNTVFYQYIDIYNDPDPDVYMNYKLNHTLTNQSVPQKLTYNPIENYSFELGANNWTFYGLGYGYVTSTKSAVGTHSYRISPYDLEGGYVKQNVTLCEGVYTLRASVWNASGDDSVYVRANGVNSEHVSSASEWQYISVPIYISAETVTISIELHSHVDGYVYFDNVSIVDGINDTRVNIVDNASFENNGTVGWSLSSPSNTTYYSINDQNDPVNSTFEDILGEYAVGITGSSTELRSIYTSINKNYFEEELTSGGTLFIGGWANTYSAPRINNANLEGDKTFRIRVDFIYNSSIIQSQYINFNQSIVSWQYVYGEIEAPAQTYDSIKISFEYQGEGEVIFDGMTVFYESSETSYEFDEYGRLTVMYKSDGSVYTYNYDSIEDVYPSTLTDENGNTIEIESDGSEVTYVTKNNIKSTPTYNAYGQVTVLQVSEVIEGEDDVDYFETSTTYMSNSQYVSSTTDEFGNTTEYYSNELSGLLEYIENAQGVKTQYEYYDNGMLMKVYIGESDTGAPYVKYVYDSMDRLVQIELDTNYYYNIHYDSAGRMDYVQVNNNTLMSYSYIVDDYGYQTGRIQDQTYGNGDMISFEYDEDNQISAIKFTGYQETEIIRFQYQYDSFGRVSVYEDVTNGITEYYEYNMSGNLSKITDNLGNEILYDYDEEGNLNSVIVSFDTLEMDSNFDYDNPINSDFYDQTWYNNGNSTIYKDYIYESSGLQRLDHIDYLNGTFNFMDYELTYQIDKTRITTITYDFYYSYADISYVYTYDSLGNVTSEVYQENGVTKVTKEYMYDEYNQLIQESVEDTRVDCTSTANIDVCYVKTFGYDINGNITNQKTFKFVDTASLVVEKEVTAYQTNNGTYSMYVLYNNHSYSYEYALDVGDNISITYQYFEWGSWPPEILGGISTSYDYSGVDTSKPGFYLIEANGHNALYTYDLDFGIVVNVGDVVAGTLVNEVTYTYDTTWKDQLDSYTVNTNGISKTSNITYDDSGNPEGITNFYYEGTKYNHAVLSWDGRQLTSIEIYSSSDNSTLVAEIWYTYNDQGIRTTKIIDDGTMIKYQYVLSGDTVLAEIVKEYNDATEEWDLLYQIAYSYDYDGSLIGFTYDTGTSKTDYIYIKNQQGDITRIVTTSGSTRVIYQYDAYGNITDISGTYASTIGKYNSFRYRSYKYDSEINLYYLNSRYYNSEIARFISADGMLSDLNNALSQNQYSYCGNNPISRNDEQGEFWHIIAGAAIGAILGGVVSYVKTGSVDWQMVAAGAVTGALVAAGGAMVVSAIQTGGAAVAGYIALNAGSSVLAQIEANGVNGDPFNKNLIGAAVGGAIGSIAKGWAPGIAALATAGINEFSNEIFWDDDDEIYSWKEVGIEAGAYAVSNYTSYLLNIACNKLGLSRGSRESTVAAANFILDLIAILFGEEIK